MALSTLRALARFLHGPTRFSFICLLVLSSTPVLAQNVFEVDGTVTDRGGNPLPLVNVRVAGTTQGTATTVDGEYTMHIETDQGQVTIVFSSIGYISNNVSVSKSGTFNVELEEDLLGFEEVVVTGTSGSTEKRQLGNAISTVNAGSIRNADAIDITQAMAGKITGALIKQTSGSPAGAISVKLRGISTINSGAEPLYIVDGVIVDNSSNELVTVGSGGVQNRLVDLNPRDIDHIEIIKGAAAAAIYGSRASNGVVQIFTKRGQAGAPRVTFTSNMVVNDVRKTVKVNNAPYDWVAPSDNSNLEKVAVNRYDYQDYIFHTGVGNEDYLSVSGGTGTTSYFLSASNYYNQGIVRNADFNRSTVRANVNQVLNDWAVVNVGTSFARSFSNDIPTGGPGFFDGSISALQFLPHSADATPDELGNYPAVGITAFGNPYEIVDVYKYTQEINRSTTNLDLGLTPLSGFSVDAVLGYDEYTQIARGFKPVGTVADPDGYTRRGDLTNKMFNADVNAQYNRNVTPNLVSTTGAGFTYQYEKYEQIINEASNLGPIVETVDGGTITASSDLISERSVRGGYLQETLGFKNKMFLTGSGRIDGSSVFGADENSQFYPKVSGSWVLSEENFWKESLGSIMSSMKLRASWGQSGNLTGIGPFERFTNYNPLSFLGQTGLVPSTQLGDENIKPETQTELELGTDFALLKNRLAFEVTYYHQKVEDLLLQRVLAPSTGANSRIENLGELTNKGLEILVRGTILQRRDVGLSVTGTFSTNSNEVVDIAGPKFPIVNGNFSRQWAIEGQPLGVFYETPYARDTDGSLLLTPGGLPQSERGNQAVYDACVLEGTMSGSACDGVVPGAMRDANGQPTGTPMSVILGSADPNWIGSLITEFDYHKWGFRMQWDAVQGFDVYNWDRRNFDRHNYRGGYDYGLELLDNPPQVECGPNGKMCDRVKGWANAAGSGLIDEEYVEDGSFVKLREIMVSYTIRPSTKWVQSVEIRLSGRNLVSIDDYRGYDPETSISGRDTGVSGFDFGSVPIPRTVIAGFTIDF